MLTAAQGAPGGSTGDADGGAGGAVTLVAPGGSSGSIVAAGGKVEMLWYWRWRCWRHQRC